MKDRKYLNALKGDGDTDSLVWNGKAESLDILQLVHWPARWGRENMTQNTDRLEEEEKTWPRAPQQTLLSRDSETWHNCLCHNQYQTK